jgi:hypothetical protein
MVLGMFLIGCQGETMKASNDDLVELRTINKERWDRLNGRKIYFGHQSVGFNIISGIVSIMNYVPDIKLHFDETNKPEDFNKPIFGHSRVGKNQNPISKMDDFKQEIENGIGSKVDIAFFKFCYVDITRDSDVNALFLRYGGVMDELIAKYPNVKFVHVTVPLTAIPRSPGTVILKLLGRITQDHEDNVKRCVFNKKLVDKYGKQVFDLAFFESSYNNGRRSFFTKDNSMYYSLSQMYTCDGGHLNKTGSVRIAEKLISFLKDL